MGTIIHRYRSYLLTLSDRFRISRERLTESRRKLDGPSTRIKKDPIPISTLSFPYSFASHQITYSLRSEHFVPAQNHPLLSNALKIQAEEKNRFFPGGERPISHAIISTRLIYLTSGSTKLPPDELEPLSFRSVPVNLLPSPQSRSVIDI